MALLVHRHRSPGCAGALGCVVVFVLLLAVGATAFTPCSTRCSPATAPHLRHHQHDLPNNNGGLPLIAGGSSCIQRLRCGRNDFSFKSNSIQYATATQTTDGDGAVHAISRAFLAESEASGRVLTKRDQKWWARFQELEEYKHEHGDCNVPQHYNANPQLGRWVNQQRQNYNKNKLESERIEALESIGFEWTRPKHRRTDDAQWWCRLGELKEYKHEHGDCNVPHHYKANPQLGNWVGTQRRRYRQNNLSSERIEALESIGFEWTRPRSGGSKPDDANWWNRFQELEGYKQEHGDCNVPINYQANLQLARWVMNQRAYYHKFIDENWKQSPGITKARIEALNKIGFEWRLRERPEWDERYDELMAYKEQHGDTLVPMDLRRDSDNKYRELAMWVLTQRQQYQLYQEGKHSYLTDERVEQLNDIGFVWDAREASWEESLAELVEFKESHGHTDVPSSWADQVFFRWVAYQRQEYRKFKEGKPTQITEERIERLESIGFEWRSKNTHQWKIRFGELRGFYDENGVVHVPQKKDKSLHRWIRAQKREYGKFVRGEKTNMDEARIEDLESIGFFEVYGK